MTVVCLILVNENGPNISAHKSFEEAQVFAMTELTSILEPEFPFVDMKALRRWEDISNSIDYPTLEDDYSFTVDFYEILPDLTIKFLHEQYT